MKNSIRTLVGLDLTFVVLLALSGSLTGIISEAVYYLAFIIPIAVGVFLLTKQGDRLDVPFRIKGEDFVLSLPIFMPAIFVILSVSYLTSLLLGSLGADMPVVEKASIFEMILIHALMPAIFEELLFRLLPMRFMRESSSVMTVTVSALSFSLVHCSLFQIPYAFAAGCIFMLIDIIFDSVYPSIILHFLNNTLSVISIKYFDTPSASFGFFLFVGALALISLAFVFIYRKKYAARLSLIRRAGVGQELRPLLLLVIPTLTVAIVNII